MDAKELTQMVEQSVKGLPITLKEITFVLPPLPLTKMSLAEPILRGGGKMVEAAYTNAFVDVIYWSLRRNYPNITREFVEDNFDATNFAECSVAFFKVNEFVSKEDKPMGEAKPAS